MSPLDLFIQRLKAILDQQGQPFYEGIEVIEVDSSLWVDNSRPRTIILVSYIHMHVVIPYRLMGNTMSSFGSGRAQIGYTSLLKIVIVPSLSYAACVFRLAALLTSRFDSRTFTRVCRVATFRHLSGTWHSFAFFPVALDSRSSCAIVFFELCF
jgi:hypothetical protein